MAKGTVVHTRDISALSEGEINERARALQETGQAVARRRDATPPPSSGEAVIPIDLRPLNVPRESLDLAVATAIESTPTVPPACVECRLIPPAVGLPGGALDVDGRCEACAIEVSPVRHSPRTAVALKAASLADRCRTAAAILEAIASDAAVAEPVTLHRRVAGIVRALVRELDGQVLT